MPKRYANFRLSDEGHELLALLAKDEGVSRTAVIEGLIRHRAGERGLRASRPKKIEENSEIGLET